VRYRWKPRANVLLAVLRETATNALLGVTPLVENKYDLPLSVGSKTLGNVHLNGLLLNGNVPLFPASAQSYETLCDAALNMPAVDCLYMLGVPTSSQFWQFLADAQTYQRWLFYSPQPESRYYYINMPHSYNEYCAQFKPKMLKNIHRELRLLESGARGHLDLVRVTDLDQVPSFLAEAGRVAEKSWQRHLVDLHLDANADRRELLEATALQGILRCYLQKCGHHPCAFVIGWQLNGLFYFHETAYDPAWAPYSPGKSLLHLIIRDCFETNRPTIFHFGPGEAPYKKWLANSVGHETTLILLKRNAVNRAKIRVHRLFRKGVDVLKLAPTVWRSRRSAAPV
jgi:hypothetical protein